MKRNLLFGFAGAVLILMFQNCGSPDYDFKVTGKGLSEDFEALEYLSSEDPLDYVESDDALDYVEAEVPSVPVCEKGYTLVGHACVQTIFEECHEFVELDRNVIPPLKTTGLCFYTKLVDAIPKHNSGAWGEPLAEDVLARGHSRGGGNPIAPFVMSDDELLLTFLDRRSIALASSAVGNQDEISKAALAIDNFILVEIQDQQTLERTMFARGTADSEPSNSPILVNGEPVLDFISYAPGGTAYVPVLDISSNFNLNSETRLRVRMLDCGGSAQASDMYLIIH